MARTNLISGIRSILLEKDGFEPLMIQIDSFDDTGDYKV